MTPAPKSEVWAVHRRGAGGQPNECFAYSPSPVSLVSAGKGSPSPAKNSNCVIS